MDDAAFEKTWKRYGSNILRYCRFGTGSQETGEDIAAETFARFLQQGDQIPEDKVEAWLFIVARNLIRSHHRRTSRWLSVMPRLATTDAPTDEHDDPTLAEMLRPLSPDQRLAVYLRVVEDRPFSEVTRITGKSEAATKMTVYRALARLRRIAERDQPASAQGSVEHE